MDPSANLGVEFSRFPVSHEGRPPDIVDAPADSNSAVNGLSSLERHGAPLPIELMPTAKKGRLESDTELPGRHDGACLGDDFDMTMEDGDCPNAPRGIGSQPGQNVGQPKPSFRDTLVGKTDLQPSEWTKEIENKGSRFAILQNQDRVEDDVILVDNRNVPHSPLANRIRPGVPLPRGKGPINVSPRGEGCSTSIPTAVGLARLVGPGEGNMELDVEAVNSMGGEDGEMEMERARDVACDVVVIDSETSLNRVNHTAVRISGKDEVPIPKERGGRVLPASIRSGASKFQAKTTIILKGGRLGTKVKKKDDRGPRLGSRLSALVSDLDKAEVVEADRSKGTRNDNVRWCENGMFNQPRENSGQD
ncbi:hypothetical protein V6N13_122746 [Hibiscus sabdariffa]|uniref:Uncharacterized protein n=2 Tax=Hibiscus sabdariffa TaxID=183260 RepID=A0ABR2P4M6_9ROSI